jgi:hypothetical protein
MVNAACREVAVLVCVAFWRSVGAPFSPCSGICAASHCDPVLFTPEAHPCIGRMCRHSIHRPCSHRRREGQPGSRPSNGAGTRGATMRPQPESPLCARTLLEEATACPARRAALRHVAPSGALWQASGAAVQAAAPMVALQGAAMRGAALQGAAHRGTLETRREALLERQASGAAASAAAPNANAAKCREFRAMPRWRAMPRRPAQRQCRAGASLGDLRPERRPRAARAGQAARDLPQRWTRWLHPPPSARE